MASSLAEKIDQHFLQCGICLESFQSPRALPCLHSFCEECLKRWNKTNKEENSTQLICPTCKQPAQIPLEGIEGFPAHFLVKDNLIKMCTKCNNPNKMAKVYCQNCMDFLCESCFDMHNTWKSLKHHRIITVEDLSSGKVSLSSINAEDQLCTEHDNEQKRFYCETCDKPVCRDCIVLKQLCRDHDTITLKQAADKQISHLKEAIKTCIDKKKKCQDAIDDTNQVEDVLSSSANKARYSLDKNKATVDAIYLVFKSDIDNLEKERNVQISQIKEELQTKMTQIKNASELGINLTGSESHHDIVSKYRNVLNTLQGVNQIQLDKVDDTLADIPNAVVPYVCLGKKWWKNRQVSITHKSIAAVAVTSDGNIAVCDYSKCVLVYSKSGELKKLIVLWGCVDVYVTPANVYVIIQFNNCVLFNSQYQKLLEFDTYNVKNEPSKARAVAVDSNGCIIIGMEDNAISIHNADGSVKSRFALPYKPRGVAVTSKEEIVVAADNDTLQLVDYSGKSILTLDHPLEVNTWKPWYVCCSKQDEVFVVNRGDPKAIYRYAAGRVYVGCVTTEVNDPWGIALSHDDQELYVTEFNAGLVKIFQRP